jgi:hypothetical protein
MRGRTNPSCTSKIKIVLKLSVIKIDLSEIGHQDDM